MGVHIFSRLCQPSSLIDIRPNVRHQEALSAVHHSFCRMPVFSDGVRGKKDILVGQFEDMALAELQQLLSAVTACLEISC